MRKRFLGLAGLGLLLATAGIVVGAEYTRHRAATFLEDFKHLEPGAGATLSFNAFMHKYRYQLTSQNCGKDACRVCREDVCQYEFVVNNWLLSTPRLVPRTEIRARITLFHGGLDAMALDYTSTVFKKENPVVHVQEDFCADRADIPCDHFALNPHGRNVPTAWNGNVEFGQSATVEQKRAAWAFNLDCFVSHSGCKDIGQLLPGLWKVTGPGIVSSRMRSTADSIAESSQPLAE